MGYALQESVQQASSGRQQQAVHHFERLAFVPKRLQLLRKVLVLIRDAAGRQRATKVGHVFGMEPLAACGSAAARCRWVPTRRLTGNTVDAGHQIASAARVLHDLDGSGAGVSRAVGWVAAMSHCAVVIHLAAINTRCISAGTAGIRTSGRSSVRAGAGAWTAFVSLRA